jgi:hypothetical protein
MATEEILDESSISGDGIPDIGKSRPFFIMYTNPLYYAFKSL